MSPPGALGNVLRASIVKTANRRSAQTKTKKRTLQILILIQRGARVKLLARRAKIVAQTLHVKTVHTREIVKFSTTTALCKESATRITQTTLLHLAGVVSAMARISVGLRKYKYAFACL